MKTIQQISDILTECEETIKRGKDTFMSVATALARIKSGELFRELGYDDFESYCLGRWKWTKRHCNRLIESAELAASAGPMGPELSERAARELADVREQDRPAVVEAASKQGAPTAAGIRKAKQAKRVEPLGNSEQLDAAQTEVLDPTEGLAQSVKVHIGAIRDDLEIIEADMNAETYTAQELYDVANTLETTAAELRRIARRAKK